MGQKNMFKLKFFNYRFYKHEYETINYDDNFGNFNFDSPIVILLEYCIG